MTDNDTNNTYPSFSARLDERLSDLSNSLVGPGHLFQSNSQPSQPWQGATPYTPGGGGGGGFHNDTSQPHSYFTYEGQQDAPRNNEYQAKSDELSSELELLQKKRAEALASISQKRAASRGENRGISDVARGNSGTQASMAQGPDAASHQPQRATRSAVDENVESQAKEESHARRTGVVEHQKSQPRQVASAEDIDGLLAEGRVSAAANASKSPVKGQLSGEYASIRRRASVLSDENSSPAANFNPHRHQNSQEPSPKLGSDGQKVNHTPTVSETVGSSVADNIEVNPHMDMKSMSGQYSRSDLKSYQEKRLYEPPRHPMAMADSNPKPHVNEPPRRLPTRSVYRSNGSPATSDRNSDRHPPSAMLASWETDNEFSKLQSNEVEELREWLEYTGYYDENYRRGKLHRFKRLNALEREREELMREDLQERETLAKSRDRASYSIDRSHSFDSLSHDPQASPSMPPPPFIPRINTTPITAKHADAKRELNSGVSDDHISSQASPSNPSKRQFSDFENGAQPERVEKMIRTQYNSSHKEVLHSEEAAPDFMNRERMHMIKDHKLPDGDNSVLGREDKKFTDQASGNWEQNTDPFIPNSPQHPDEGQVGTYGGRGGSIQWRGRGRGRGRGLVRGRGRGRGGSNAGSTRGIFSYSEMKGSDELGLMSGDVSYFLIKCVAYEMVNAAKIEGIWATQEKNVERLAAAFDNSRHVVLVFSVNQSGAFQGYARMDSHPGAPGVTTPSWLKKPGLPLGPPFRITWYNKVETMFKYVGHLKNPYNENHDVTYARDGQELEAECGRILCGLLDKSLDFVSPSG
ncbi:hypothetical protein GX51_04876 [Blastomyces parvus]|uniref:YTH domain-containing protein n=1 Tax=Blastomyces parvus TaxID=2060905 RepID=A0A2B7WRQ2_9EURO|nr:hypothetical protein GX51_04876 [Blastomyces parvus]